ncbi:type II toxin-antitoxin system ParD family antitoxin [Sulfitobacter sp. JB4-11]|uniref:type II toxin-antitoxin system ParD family antitoxin n=1 Tax=Sulfitobacter rhodophyticola TaxID=3238304 RepID=UPI003518DC47
MATTSFSLGEHWDKFIKEQVAEGRYGSASEVVREALRHMEIERDKLAALRAHVQEGIRDADAGRFVDDFDIQDVIARAKART